MSKVITDEARDLIGADLGAMRIEVDKSATKKYASAIRFPNPPEPRYYDEDTKGGLIAPATFSTSIAWLGPILEKVNPTMGKYRVGLNGGQEYEYHASIRPGDVLTAHPRLADLSEKPREDGGVMLVMNLQCDIENQNGEQVLTARQTLLRIYGPENLQ